MFVMGGSSQIVRCIFFSSLSRNGALIEAVRQYSIDRGGRSVIVCLPRFCKFFAYFTFASFIIILWRFIDSLLCFWEVKAFDGLLHGVAVLVVVRDQKTAEQ